MVREAEDMKDNPKQIIGRSEIVALPELGIDQLAAKIDTGAYSSSIDCAFAAEVKGRDATVLEYTLFHPSHSLYSGHKLQTADYVTTEVTSSHGVSQRFVIYTMIEFRGIRVRSRVTLTNRQRLRYPLLLGRQFLTGKFIVDVDLGAGLAGDEEERKL